MKKIFLTLTAVLFAGILFTSASPSLDGRAVVAAEGVFPRGYFAKTVGYLPGDSIKVTNPVNGERIDILVIGSLDASDGVAILLSPEAAEALSIKRNSNNLVKLTKRNGTADDVVSGNALITKGEDAEDENEIAEEIAEEIAQAEEAEEIPESAIDYSEDLTFVEDEAAEAEENAAEEIAQIEDEISEEDSFDDFVAIEIEDEIPEEVAEEIVQAENENENEEIEEIEAEEIAQAEEAEEIPESAIDYSEDLTFVEDEAEEDAVEEIAEIEDEVLEDEIPEENISEEFVKVDDEIPEEVAVLPPEYEYVEADDIFDDEEVEDFSERVNEDEIPEEFAFEIDAEKIPEENISEEVVSQDDESEANFGEENFEINEDTELAEEFDERELTESDIFENLLDDEAEEIPELAEEDSFEDEEYEAIVLVPSEDNPPAQREETRDENENIPPANAASNEEKPAPKNEKSYVATSELAPRKYYVQIAVYNEDGNVEEVNKLYGKRYPIVVLEKGRRKTVMVGPFNVDEYGIILERFKAYGFKDAFVKSTF